MQTIQEEGKNQVKVTPVIVRRIFSWMKTQLCKAIPSEMNN